MKTVVVPSELGGEMLSEMWRALNAGWGTFDHATCKYVWNRVIAASPPSSEPVAQAVAWNDSTVAEFALWWRSPHSDIACRFDCADHAIRRWRELNPPAAAPAVEVPQDWDGKDRRCEHDMKWISDWYGDPDVINGTADCSRSECQLCNWIDPNGEPPSEPDDF